MNEKIPLSKGGYRIFFFQYLNPNFEFECVRMLCLLYKFVSVCVEYKSAPNLSKSRNFRKKNTMFFDFIIVCPNCIIQFGEVGWS